MIMLQFSGSSQFGSRIIQYGTWSWAGHVDFVLPDGSLLGSVATSPTWCGKKGKPGVCYHDMKPLKEYSRVERYTVDASDAVLEYAKSQLGKPYDWIGVLNFVVQDSDWMDEDKWFCSELVAWAFEMAGDPLIRGVSNRITPAALLYSTKLQYVGLPNNLK